MLTNNMKQFDQSVTNQFLTNSFILDNIETVMVG